MSERRERGLEPDAAEGPPAKAWSALLSRAHARPAMAVVLCTMTPAFGFFVTATVLPSIVADIGGLAFYAWTSTAYAVTSILGSAGSSVVVRRTGTRATLLIAAGLLAAGTSVCALAPTMLVLIGGRALQGLGGGMMTAGVHGVVREVFPEHLWPRMLATISGTWLFGAFLLSPLAALAIASRLAASPEDRTGRRGQQMRT